VLLYDGERRQLVGQVPGFGLLPEQVRRVRYSVDGLACRQPCGVGYNSRPEGTAREENEWPRES